MSGQLAFIVQPEAEILRHLAEVLNRAGFKVLGAQSVQDAFEQLEKLAFLPPDVILAPLAEPRIDGSDLCSRLREHPLTHKTPIVVLSNGDGEERRQALRLGLSHVVPAPWESEELVLTVRLALAQHRDERLLSGSLEQMPVPDLLQTLEASRRTGTIVLKSRGRRGTLWLREGRVIDAEVEGGARGQEAVFTVASWQQGTFEAEFGSVAVPERIFESTSFLLLEAMRRLDEGQREKSPPFAAIPDSPPPPPRALLATHRALTLLAVAASYAGEHLAEPLVEERLERSRRERLESHPLLVLFAVGPLGRTALVREQSHLEDLDVEALVEGVAQWLRLFFADLESALPGRFSLQKLKTLTEAVGEDLDSLGFYTALGLVREAKENRT